MTTKIAIASICTAFNPTGVIGSKVLNFEKFLEVVTSYVEAYDFNKCLVSGQGFLSLPEVLPFVSGGVGRHVADPSAYVLHLYRGRVISLLKRRYASPVTGCNVVVYTREAYCNDPEVTQEESSRVANSTHVLVAVLVGSGSGPSQLSPHRFTANLSGGNREAELWTADEIRSKAKDVMAYDNEWTVVADD